MLDDDATPRDEIERDDEAARRLAVAFIALVVACFALIVLGALVRANAAGLACPDWPLCFGEFVPAMNVKVGFEWTHRVVAGSVSLVFATLAFLAVRRQQCSRATVRLLGLAATLLVVQIMLGALTVWLALASWTVTAHLLTGNAFALTLLLIACALRDEAAPPTLRAPAPPAARRAIAVAAVLLALQMALGGLVSSQYAGLACPEWPACIGGAWFPSFRGTVGLHLLHRLNGYALATALVAAAVASRHVPGLARLTAIALALGLAQVAVGVANVLTGIPVEVTGLHSALAAGLVLVATLAVRDVTMRPRAVA